MKHWTKWSGGLVALFFPFAAQAASWVGNTKLFLNGIEFPRRAGFVEAHQSLTITTQTWPILPNQAVTLVYTTNNWVTQSEIPFHFDFNVGNNSQWWAVLGPLPRGTQLDFYLRATGPGDPNQYDNNSWANFGFTSRWSPTFRSGPVLQWFETDYKTMLTRLPEVVRAGYGAIYLPSPVKSGGGGFSVGYNPFDRFDLGDRLQKGSVRTKYGTTQELQTLIRTAKRFGLEVYCDTVLNHNDNRASSAINTYPDMIPEDFHIYSSSNTGNNEINFNNNPGPFSHPMLNEDLVGLADIAHEDGNATATAINPPSYAPLNSFNKPSFVRHPLVPQYYANGSPVAEDVRQYLARWMSWMTDGIGFDGYRLDAVKHMAPQFLGYAADQPVTGRTYGNGNLLPTLYANHPQLYIFGESYTSNSYELREYAKTGMNLLDFPFFFGIRNLANANGYGDLGQSLGNMFGLDTATGLAYENGGLSSDAGLAFVQSHDDGPPTANNLAYAYLLTRQGRPKVYYDGNNIAPNNWSNFPRPGRGDALQSGGILDSLLDVHHRFARGTMFFRVSQPDLLVFERQVSGQSTLLVALNDRGDISTTPVSVTTAFPAGTVLHDYSNQRPDVTVQAGGLVSFVVPSNSSATVSNNATGYVLYAPYTAEATTSPTIQFEVDGLDSETRKGGIFSELVKNPAGSFGGEPQTYSSTHVRTNSPLNLVVQTNNVGATAYVQLDNGLPFAGLTPLTGTTEGLKDGFVPMSSSGNGKFRLDHVSLAGLEDGVHLLRVRVFNAQGSGPQFFSEFQEVLFVERSRLNRSVQVDGSLLDLGSPLNSQFRTASSNGNRLDALYVRNDVDTLYVGVAGNVDGSEGYTNGFFAFLDTDPLAGTGVTNMSLLANDTGPATRLLSRRKLTAPNTFGAELGLAVFRNSSLSTGLGFDVRGTATLPYAFGAEVGLYRLQASQPSNFAALPLQVAFQPRVNKTDPAKGFEIAIRLADVFPQGIVAGQKLGLIAGLGSTGETDTTLFSTDPLRATLGGHPLANPWNSNQFLPTQSTVVNDPGTNAVTLTTSVNYTIQRATTVTASGFTVTERGRKYVGNELQISVRVTNTGTGVLAGPLHLLTRIGVQDQLLNRTGVSFVNPAPFVDLAATSLLPGRTTDITLRIQTTNSNLVPVYELTRGAGTF